MTDDHIKCAFLTGLADTNSESGLGDSPEDGIEDHDSDDSDSSEAPEDVCFAASREKEQKRMEDILNQIKKDRADKKDRLRKKDDLFKQQKVLTFLKLERCMKL